MENLDGGKLVLRYFKKCTRHIYDRVLKTDGFCNIRNEARVFDAINLANGLFVGYIDRVFNLPSDDMTKLVLQQTLEEYEKNPDGKLFFNLKDYVLRVKINGAYLVYSLKYNGGKIEYIVNLNELVNNGKIIDSWQFTDYHNNEMFLQVLRGSYIYYFSQDSKDKGCFDIDDKEELPVSDYVRYFLEKIKKEKFNEIYKEGKVGQK